MACHQPIQTTDVGSALSPVTATAGQQLCSMGTSAPEEPTPTLFDIIRPDQVDHEGFMVATMNPVNWGSVLPRTRQRPELVFCPTAKIFRIFSGHEGFHEGFHEGPPSSWQP